LRDLLPFCAAPRPLPPTLFPYTTLFRSVCAFLLAGRRTLIPTGIPGDAVAFGMGAEEVTQAAGPPDGTRSENGVRTGFFLYYYQDRKSTRLNSSHVSISYAVFCVKKQSN